MYYEGGVVQLEQAEHSPVFDASLISGGSVTTVVAVAAVGTAAASLSK